MKKHYDEIAHIFTYAKYITLIALVLFILFALNFYREDISMENFRYMIKYLDFAAPDSSAAVSNAAITFDGDAAVKTVLYRNDIAVIKRTGLDLYDLSGQKIFSSEYTMTTPTAVCSDKYMLVFDLGGTYAAVYNTFSKIWETTFEYPIIDATVTDKGEFCIATSEKGYTSAVYIYNSDFKKIYSWRSGDKYVIDVAMSRKNDGRFLLSTLRAQNGFYTSELIMLSKKQENAIASVSLYDNMILEASDFEKSITILTDKAVLFLNSQTLETLTSVTFSRDSLQNFTFNDDYSVLLLSKKIIGSENEISIYRNDGEHLHTFLSQGHIMDICLSKNNLYQLTSGVLTIYDLTTFESNTLSVDKRYDALLSAENTVVLASSTDAVTVKGD